MSVNLRFQLCPLWFCLQTMTWMFYITMHLVYIDNGISKGNCNMSGRSLLWEWWVGVMSHWWLMWLCGNRELPDMYLKQATSPPDLPNLIELALDILINKQNNLVTIFLTAQMFVKTYTKKASTPASHLQSFNVTRKCCYYWKLLKTWVNTRVD